MEFENLSRKDLEILQMIGYFKVFLWNFRFWDLAKFIWRYRSEGMAVVRKIFMGRKPPPVNAIDDEPERISPYFQSLDAEQPEPLMQIQA